MPARVSPFAALARPGATIASGMVKHAADRLAPPLDAALAEASLAASDTTSSVNLRALGHSVTASCSRQSIPSGRKVVLPEAAARGSGQTRGLAPNQNAACSAYPSNPGDCLGVRGAQQGSNLLSRDQPEAPIFSRRAPRPEQEANSFRGGYVRRSGIGSYCRLCRSRSRELSVTNRRD